MARISDQKVSHVVATDNSAWLDYLVKQAKYAAQAILDAERQNLAWRGDDTAYVTL